MSAPSLTFRVARPAAVRDLWLAVLVTSTVFTSALLLFLVQPMVAKGLLPLFGGTSAVWTTAMLFFQAALLAGYGLAHFSLGKLGPQRQSRLQLAIVALPALFLPLAAPTLPQGDNPLLALLILLAAGVGLPFLVLSTASPVFQRWFSVSGHPRAGNPYVLYVASNIGSLLALLAYPLLIEPNLPLDVQRSLWSAGYVVFLGLTAACALTLFPPGAARTATPPLDVTPVAPATTALAGARFERVRWLLLAFVPSSLMLGVTAYLTTDIASVPLLWILPLALYLASFIVAFSRFGPVATRTAQFSLPFLAAAVVVDMLDPIGLPIALRLAMHLSFFAAAAVMCHGRLAAERPAPTRLTEFYLFLALGGAAGGIVNGILAPELLDAVLEYPIAIALALALGRRLPGHALRRWGVGLLALTGFLVGALAVRLIFPTALGNELSLFIGTLPLLVFALPVPYGLIIGLVLAASIVLGPPVLFTERNFFGLIQVVENPGEHVLIHGTTVHGRQAWPPDPEPVPNGYYHPAGPLGDVMKLTANSKQVAVLGLGAGGIAAYGQPGQEMIFYEIDPEMAVVAQNDRLFTYLSSSDAEIGVAIGDGRLLIAREPAGRFDLIVMDAFTSDSVPLHLLTREAFEIYRDRLAPGGVLAIHISNRFVDLRSVVSAAARDLGLVARARLDGGGPADDPRSLHAPSLWVVVTRDAARLHALPATWQPLPATTRAAWTDDFSDIVSVLDWRGDILR